MNICKLSPLGKLSDIPISSICPSLLYILISESLLTDKPSDLINANKLRLSNTIQKAVNHVTGMLPWFKFSDTLKGTQNQKNFKISFFLFLTKSIDLIRIEFEKNESHAL